MTLSVDDQVTLVELAVIVIGVVLTWAMYRRSPPVSDDPTTEPSAMRGGSRRRSADHVPEEPG